MKTGLKLNRVDDNIIDIIIDNKNFLFLWFAQILTQSAVSFINGAIAYLSNEGVLASATEESSAGIGIILILSAFPAIIFGPIAGVFADWFSKRKIMIISNLSRFAFLALFITLRGWENQAFAYFMVLTLSIILQFFIPAEGGLIPRITNKKFILLANSLFSLTVYASLAVGFFFAGPIIELFGIATTFLICGFMFLLSTFFTLQIRLKISEKREAQFREFVVFIRKLFTGAYEGIKYSFKNKILRFSLTHLFILQIGGLSLVTFIYKIGSEIYGVSAESAGIVSFLPLVLGLLFGILGLNTLGQKRNRISLIITGVFINFIGFFLMGILTQRDSIVVFGLSPGNIFSTISLFVVGLSIPYLLIPAQTLIYENADEDFRGRVLGVWLALTTSLASVVATFIGYFSDRMGSVSGSIAVLATMEFIYLMMLVYLHKRKGL